MSAARTVLKLLYSVVRSAAHVQIPGINIQFFRTSVIKGRLALLLSGPTDGQVTLALFQTMFAFSPTGKENRKEESRMVRTTSAEVNRM